MIADGIRRATWVALLFLYLGFVVYGSLVPLDLRSMPLDQAISRFLAIRYLDLGAGSRADWVANIVLYVPLGFLACASVLGLGTRSHWSFVALPLIVVGCVAVAVSVEFTQLFFAPRTVSLNDLFAELIGTLIGVGIWVFGRWQVVALARAFATGGRASVVAAAVIFALVYVLLALFPYDVVISVAELSQRLRASSATWLIASCGNWPRCVAVSAAEALALVPLGVLLVVLRPRRRWRELFFLGCALGLVLEVLQLLFVSGVSQGLSILWRGAGLWLGGLAGYWLMRLGPGPFAALTRRWLPVLAVLYLLALVLFSGWLDRSWMPAGQALARLSTLGWIPFYYHYWTSEPIAMVSLLGQLGAYAPVGLGYWAWSFDASDRRRGALAVGLVTLMLAILVEAGKLFVPATRPDPTNLLIAPVGALLAYLVTSWLSDVLSGAANAPTIEVARAGTAKVQGAPERLSAESIGRSLAHDEAAVSSPSATTSGRSLAGFSWLPLPALQPIPPTRVPTSLVGLLLLTVATLGCFLYPFGPVLLLTVLLGFAGLVWWRPGSLLLVMPLLITGLDLSPWTGRLLLNELDLFVLVGLGLGSIRLSGVRPGRWPNGTLQLALVLLWASCLLALWRGLSAQWGPDISLAASHTPLESWLVAKGLLWALLTVPILRRLRRLYGSAETTALLMNGVVLALAWTCLTVVWERLVFVGLFDLDNVFRVTGPFASMNTGGAYIEAWLAFAFPVLLVWLVRQRSLGLRIIGALLVIATGYAMLVTFSRGGYGGLLVGGLLAVAGLLVMGKRQSRRQWALPMGLVALLGVLAVPAFSTGFAQERLAKVGNDLRFRLGHWQDAMTLMQPGSASVLIGEGFGRYPSLYLLSGRGKRPAGTFLVSAGVLRMGGGEALYLDQRVAARSQKRYTVEARLRGPEGGGELSVALCEKALLYSFDCVWGRLDAPPADRGWVDRTTTIASRQIGRGGRWPHGPTKLSLYNSGGGLLEVDRVSLRDADGRELLINGGFDDGAERWLFVTDQDPAWHIHEQFVELYFAQGLLGLLAFALLLVAVGKVAWPAIRAGRSEAVALSAAVVAFIAVGSLGSTMDTARSLALIYLGLFALGLLVRTNERPGRRRPRAPGKDQASDSAVRSERGRSSTAATRLSVANNP